MAEDNDAEKSFEPTPRRLEQAREKGQIARSRELATAAIALAATVSLWWSGPEIFRRSLTVLRDGLALERAAMVEPDRMATALAGLSWEMLLAIAPLLAMVLVTTLGAPMLLSGWVYSSTVFSPDFSRLNPVRGMGNMFSAQSLVELGKAIAKCLLLGGIGYWVIASSWDELQQLSSLGLAAAIGRVGGLMSFGLLCLAGGLAIIALVDVPWQIHHLHHKLRMTRQDVVEEQREMEGDPQLKARIRSQQREIAQRRMMAAVPKASVIVTNPTHYAVALDYRNGATGAPRVVAKGMNLVAQRIREIGAEHGVPVLEVPPLARALYRHADIGDEIPPALYTVVAQVLAYVYQLQRHRAAGTPAPALPADLEVPAALDPLRAAGAQP